jgi:LysM repeat protein
MRSLFGFVLASTLLLVAAPAWADRIRYEVAPGDTLLGIALEYDVTVDELRRWNRIRGDLLQIGQELTIHTRSGGSERVRDEYTVRSGDTGLAIARRLGVTISELERWNSRVDIDRLRIGQRLVYYTYVDTGSTASAGSPNRGRLRGGMPLGEGVGYRVRDASRAFATPSTIAALRNGVARVGAHFGHAPELVVHDLSFERGGSMRPHLSHQNGLDADVSYYCVAGGEVCPYVEIGPDDLDVARQWYLFSTWITLGQVEYIFVDWELQAPLREHARARGATDEQLAEWFQYPERGRRGIIRDEPGHDDHFHVRFTPGAE